MTENVIKTINGVKWTAIEKFSVQGVNFFIGIILARLLLPSDFGTIGMLAIFIAISTLFIDGGFSNALVRKLECSEIDYSTVFYCNILVSVACYFVLYFCSGLISSFFSLAILEPIIKVVSLNLIINSLIVVQIAKLNRSLNFKIQARINFVAAFLSGIIGIYLAYAGYGVWALVWQSVSNAIFRALGFYFHSKWIPLLVFSRQSFTELFSYGSKILMAGLLNTIYVNSTTMLIGKMYSATDLGYYTRGFHLAQFPSTNISGILQKVTFPLLAKLQNDDYRLISVYRKYIQVTSMGIFFLMMLLCALAHPLVILLFTSKWEGCVHILQIICFALMFDHISSINLNLLQVKGRSDLFLKLEVIKKTISLSFLLLAIPFGVLAICFSQVIYVQIAMFINTYYTGKLFGLKYTTQWRDFFPYLICSFISCVPSYLITFLPFPFFIQLIVGVLISTSLYVILLKIKKDKHLNIVNDILLNKVRITFKKKRI
jgi:O-antigen/teichoic acid export membrane protein